MNPCRVLFLCNQNASRSIMHEAVLRHLGTERFVAYSAGRRPAGQADPDALDALHDVGIATAGLVPKSWHEYTGAGAPHFDIVIRVCGVPTEDDCPSFASAPAVVQWPVADPGAQALPLVARAGVFREALTRAMYRVMALAQLPVESMSREQLTDALRTIGERFADAVSDDD